MENNSNNFGEKVWNVIKKILLIITSPIWFPWKVLFVRKEGRKFNQVDANTKMFRILRSPITKTLKFIVFLGIIFLEILIVHKVRYSSITYPFTKNAVMNYYLDEKMLEADGLDGSYKEEFETAFGYIDEWGLDEKNKMNVILNSDFFKDSLKYTDNEAISYILNKFNTDSVFRENVRIFVKNINGTITRFINEIPEKDFAELKDFLGPIINVSSWAIDYAGVLDIGGAVFNWAQEKYSIPEKSLKINAQDIEKGIKTGMDFGNGSSLQTVLDYWK